MTDVVDLEILRARLLRSRFELADIRRQEWDPMVWNPGTALHLLLSREFAPAAERAESLRRRIEAIPDSLADARAQLGEMSAIHVETAIAQFEGTRHLLDTDARALAGRRSRWWTRSLAHVDDFVAWLRDRLPEATRSPRLGERLYAGALWHELDDDATPDALIRDAQVHLELIGTQLARGGVRVPGRAG